jgi:hypothetical protein
MSTSDETVVVTRCGSRRFIDVSVDVVMNILGPFLSHTDIMRLWCSNSSMRRNVHFLMAMFQHMETPSPLLMTHDWHMRDRCDRGVNIVTRRILEGYHKVLKQAHVEPTALLPYITAFFTTNMTHFRTMQMPRLKLLVVCDPYIVQGTNRQYLNMSDFSSIRDLYLSYMPHDAMLPPCLLSLTCLNPLPIDVQLPTTLKCLTTRCIADDELPRFVFPPSLTHLRIVVYTWAMYSYLPRVPAGVDVYYQNDMTIHVAMGDHQGDCESMYWNGWSMVDKN